MKYIVKVISALVLLYVVSTCFFVLLIGSGCTICYKGIYLPNGLVSIPTNATNASVDIRDVLVEISGGGVENLGYNK